MNAAKTTLAIALAAAPAAAQPTILSTVTGVAPGDAYGRSVCGVGDVDNDGVPDFAVGTDQPNTSGAGYVRIHSGATGAVILTIPSAIGNVEFGFAISAAGDLDGDGRGDVLIGDPMWANGGGAPTAGFAGVYSSATGALLLSIPSPIPATATAYTGWGFSLDVLGDVSGDGLPDYVIGAPFSDPPGGNSGTHIGHAAVVSGASGAPIFVSQGVLVGDEYGFSVANAGDVDGDGANDFVVGAHQANGGLSASGYARVFSGASGLLLANGGLAGGAPTDHFGYSLDGAGDLDGDGFADVVVGIPGASGGGQVVVFSGASIASGPSASVLHNLTTVGPSNLLGWRVRGIGDVNADGTPDVLTNDHITHANVFDGSDGNDFFPVDAASNHPLGPAIDGVGDVNGDGCFDFVVGTDATGANGTAYLVSGCGAAFNYGPTSGAVIGWSGSLSAAADAFTLTVTGAAPSSSGYFIYGPEVQSVPFYNGFLLVGPLPMIWRIGLDSPITTDGAGAATKLVDLALPSESSTFPSPSITGTSQWSFQFWYREGGSANLSDGLRVLFAP